MQLILDGRSSNASQILAGYAQAIIDGYNAELAQAGASPPPASAVVARVWFNPNQDALWNTVPSLLAILVALEGLMVTALSVARERELGTFEQLLVSPLSPVEIVVGKTVPAMLIGLGEGTLVVAVATLYFRVPLTGSLALLYAAMTVYLLAVVGVGLFISSLALTQQQAILGTFAFMVPQVLLSGFASPVENMPDWLQTATLANPLRHFIVIVKGVFLKAMPLEDVLAQPLAARGPRARHALGGHLALPPPNRMNCWARDSDRFVCLRQRIVSTWSVRTSEVPRAICDGNPHFPASGPTCVANNRFRIREPSCLIARSITIRSQANAAVEIDPGPGVPVRGTPLVVGRRPLDRRRGNAESWAELRPRHDGP